MNVVFHALAGGAIAHGGFLAAPRSRPSVFTLSCVGLASIASHGVLDWLRHGYPIPSMLDVALGLTLSGGWLLCVRSQFRVLFSIALVGAFLPDVIDHVPRLVRVASPLQGPIFPWHAPPWSGSMYPTAHIRQGTGLTAIEAGNNALFSMLNHALVVGIALGSVYFGRAAFVDARTLGLGKSSR